VQLAKALGAEVIAVGSTEEKRALALEVGADHAIEPEPGALKERVRGLTDRRGADVILEQVGGDLFDACLRAIAWEGRLVIVGFAGGRIPTIKAGHVLVKNIDLIGLQSSDYREKDPGALSAAYDVLLRLYSGGLIRAHVSASYPLERAAEALEEVRSGRVKGKVVLTTEAAR
jgi:NADPH:quinone reductase